LVVRQLGLMPGEKVLVDIRPHWSYLSGPLAAALVAIGVGVTLDVAIPHTSVALHWVEGLVVAVPCLWLAIRTLGWLTTKLILTSFRLIEQWGVFSRRSDATPLADIASVTVVQSLMRRIVGTGRLELELFGEDGVRGIDDVRKPVILQRVITRRLRPYPSPEPMLEPDGP
jgi:uncharacterized membrane protein YdbT with pleckstrin-like domain